MSEITGIPRIGDAAPQFTAPSTHGEISLSQYAGKWI
ncbi:MAG: peroxiredoxin, partial [Deltaproteobacteria bacterium]|nr:peroxiredoxin [Deltaproteobacteria bacterium]